MLSLLILSLIPSFSPIIPTTILQGIGFSFSFSLITTTTPHTTHHTPHTTHHTPHTTHNQQRVLVWTNALGTENGTSGEATYQIGQLNLDTCTQNPIDNSNLQYVYGFIVLWCCVVLCLC